MATGWPIGQPDETVDVQQQLRVAVGRLRPMTCLRTIEFDLGDLGLRKPPLQMVSNLGTTISHETMGCVEARKNPEYLKGLASAVTDFREALVDLLELYVENGEAGGLGGFARGIAPAVLLREGADLNEVARRQARASRAAGLAAAAVPLTNVGVAVQGVGVVDPIAAWQTITRPKPLLEAIDVLGACDQALGRLEGLILKAEAERPPAVGAEAMHPTVWGAASRLWRDGHFREGVAAAAEAVALMVKSRTGRNDVADTALWQEAFSDREPASGKPRLRWPGDPARRDVATMNSGLRFYAPGVQMTIRNSVAHGAGQLDEQAAVERLAALSLLARWVDECDLVEAPAERGKAT